MLALPVYGADILYADEDVVNIFEEPTTSSAIVGYVYGGDTVLVETYSDDGGWVGRLISDPSGDGQGIGWIRMSDLSYVMPSRYCNHQWTDWVVYTEPTCTEGGMQTHECVICGVGEGVDIPPLGHSFGEWTVTKPATCIAEGTMACTCARCGLQETQTIPRTEHTYGNWTVAKPATCIADGQQVRKCTVCGNQETQVIPKTGHTFGAWNITKQPTCTVEGQQIRKCTVCGYQETQAIAKTPHTWGDWKITKEAKCTEEGERVHTCKVCSVQEKEVIAKLPHDLQWEVITQPTDHSAGIRKSICKVCSYIDAEESFDPEGTLRPGASGEAVQQIQQLLIDQKYLNEGGADGIYGAGTENAIKAFQTDKGFTADGIAWPQTIQKLQHRFGKWKTVKPLTRTEAGERKHKCKDCGFVETQPVALEPAFIRGDRGESIRAIQQLLTTQGCDAGAYDGIYGPQLDTAFDKFAKEHNIVFEAGEVVPAEIDALVNAWIASLPADSWKTDNTDLILTVTPASKKENKKDEIVTYNWTVTNMGSEGCILTCLLLNYSDDPDFKSDNLVMLIDGIDLQAGGSNTASGSINVSKEWSEKEPAFCAMAVIQGTDNSIVPFFSNVE